MGVRQQHLSSSQVLGEQIVVGITAMFGAVCCIIIILLLILLRKIRFHHYQLILWLNVGTLSYETVLVSNLFSLNETSFCVYQAFLDGFTALSTCGWTFCILLSMYYLVVRDRRCYTLYTLEKYQHLISWGIPFFFNVIPFFFDAYGPLGGPKCWVTNRTLQFVVFYLPLTIFMFLSIVLYSFIRCTMCLRRSQWRTKWRKRERRVVNTLKYYVFVIIVCFFWAFIHRVVSLFIYPDEVYFISFLHSFFTSVHGVLNLVVFFLDPEILVSCKPSNLRKELARFLGTDVIEFNKQEVIEIEFGAQNVISDDDRESDVDDDIKGKGAIRRGGGSYTKQEVTEMNLSSSNRENGDGDGEDDERKYDLDSDS